MAEDVLFDQDQDQDTENQNSSNSNSVVEARYKISPLSLTVFKRKTGNGNIFRNYNLQRTYPEDEEGSSFGHTESLRPRDLRKAARLLQKAADDVQGLQTQKVESSE